MSEKPWVDPIVEEVRAIREAHAAEFDYDLDAIFQDIKAREKASGRKLVSYPPRRPRDHRASQDGAA